MNHSDDIVDGCGVLDVDYAAHVVLQLAVRELLQSILNQLHHLLSQPVETGVRALQKDVKVDYRARGGVFKGVGSTKMVGGECLNELDGTWGVVLDAREGTKDKVHSLSLVDAVFVLLKKGVELGQHVFSDLLGLSVILEGVLNNKESFSQDTHISGLSTTILHLLKNIQFQLLILSL